MISTLRMLLKNMKTNITPNMHSVASPNGSTFNSISRNISIIDPKNNAINNDYMLTSKDVIRKINPVVIPRISSISNMALCERAAYNISFFGMESGDFSADGVLGNAIHRIILRSIMEITGSLKSNSNTVEHSDAEIKRDNAKEIFIRNAKRDVQINWKQFMLADVDNPLPDILDDIEIRSHRLVNQLFSEQKEHKRILFRPEFTIRNIKIPLEGRLDLIKIKLKEKREEEGESDYYKENEDSPFYI